MEKYIMNTLPYALEELNKASSILWATSPAAIVPYLVHGYSDARGMDLAEAKEYIARSIVREVLKDITDGEPLYTSLITFNSGNLFTGGRLTNEAWRDILQAVKQMDGLMGYPMMELQELLTLLDAEDGAAIDKFCSLLDEAAISVVVNKMTEKLPLRALLTHMYKRSLQRSYVGSEYRAKLEQLKVVTD